MMEIDDSSLSQHSRTTSVDENVKMSQLVIGSNQQTGLLTPPASMRGCSSPSSFSLESKPLTREEKQAVKEAKKAAKLAKKEKKKQEQQQQQTSTENDVKAKGKETLSDQIVEGFIEQLRMQTGLSEDKMSDQELIGKYISVDIRMKRLDLNKDLPPLPPMTAMTTTLTNASSSKSPLSTYKSSPFAFSQKRLKSFRSVKMLRTEACLEDERKSLERLINRYGRTAHMGVLDPSYKSFLSADHSGAIYYKVHDSVAVVAGDPLCAEEQVDRLLDEFALFRRKNGWGMVFMGVSEGFKKYAQKKKWTTMHFGWDRYLNPTTNVLLNQGEKMSDSTKRMLTQCRSLLNPNKGNVEFGIYIPAIKKDERLQKELEGVYEDWRKDRNGKGGNQAFITVYDPFSLERMMVYLYTRDRTTKVANGFAALRRLGVEKGYQLDPYIQAPGCTLKGISELLVYGAMSLLKRGKVEYMSFGIEPSEELGEITGMNGMVEGIVRKVYKKVFKGLPLGGKKKFHEKWRVEEGHKLYLVGEGLGVRGGIAIGHYARVGVLRVLFS